MGRILHPILPVFDSHSEILILGSFPSLKSREQCFFYGHPRNRFWQVMANVFGAPVPFSVEEKTDFLLSHRVALWDVIASCEVVGSADSSIQNVLPNDVGVILAAAPIRHIFVNGKTAEKYYNMYIKDKVGREAVYLPSTSPANAAWPFEKLIAAWKIIKEI